MFWIAVAVGAAAGAPTRFAIDRWFVRRGYLFWPYGTFVVNLAGSLILGLLTGISASIASAESQTWLLFTTLVGTGFCGALTTFSGWVAQIAEASTDHPNWRGSVYALTSVVFGFGLASLGYVIGQALG